MTDDHVVILADERTLLGLFVLLNSLARNGFDGTVWIGRRANVQVTLRVDLFTKLPFVTRIIDFRTERPFAYLKADAVAQIAADVGDDLQSISYMDCDLVLDCEWDFVRAWIGDRVAVVQDQPHRHVGSEHPVRLAWAEFIAASGEAVRRTPDGYYNSGFVGISRANLCFVRTWQHLSLTLERSRVRPGPELPFVHGQRDPGAAPALSKASLVLLRQAFLEDQDGFNMAIMSTNVPLSVMGPDAMGFTAARTPVLAHAVGPEKPWTTRYVRRLMTRGIRVSVADDTWWKYASAPIPVATGRAWAGRRADWLAAKAASRLIGR